MVVESGPQRKLVHIWLEETDAWMDGPVVSRVGVTVGVVGVDVGARVRVGLRDTISSSSGRGVRVGVGVGVGLMSVTTAIPDALLFSLLSSTWQYGMVALF